MFTANDIGRASSDDDRPLSLLSHIDLTERLNQIADLCRKHNNPASNVGAHALAAKVLKIVEGT